MFIICTTCLLLLLMHKTTTVEVFMCSHAVLDKSLFVWIFLDMLYLKYTTKSGTVFPNLMVYLKHTKTLCVLCLCLCRILIYYDGVEMSFEMPGNMPHFKCIKKGRVYLTTHRVRLTVTAVRTIHKKTGSDRFSNFMLPGMVKSVPGLVVTNGHW